jgi:hypothetical protein
LLTRICDAPQVCDANRDNWTWATLDGWHCSRARKRK